MGDVFIPGLTDLFGDPVPASRGKKGRPPHIPTADFRRFVQLALACGQEEEDIAAALGIHHRTLKRHYFHELGGKRSARLRLDMKNMAAMVAQVEAGNVAAMALLEKKMERLRLAALSDRVINRSSKSEAKPPKLGKKEAAKVAAGEVKGKFAPPEAPKLLN
jgi:hypothetical protein